MKMFAKHRASWAITALTTLSGVIVLLIAGNDIQVPAHWNAAGEVTRMTTPAKGLFIAPSMQVFTILLLSNLHLLEPRKEHLKKAQGLIYIVIFGGAILGAGIQGMTIATTFGYEGSTSIIYLLIGALFAIIGNYMGKLQSTFTVGIRTPWTLFSEDNWRKTHRLGGKLIMTAGIATMVGSIALTAKLQFVLMMATILPATIIPIVYSWLLWRKEQAN